MRKSDDCLVFVFISTKLQARLRAGADNFSQPYYALCHAKMVGAEHVLARAVQTHLRASHGGSTIIKGAIHLPNRMGAGVEGQAETEEAVPLQRVSAEGRMLCPEQGKQPLTPPMEVHSPFPMSR